MPYFPLFDSAAAPIDSDSSAPLQKLEQWLGLTNGAAGGGVPRFVSNKYLATILVADESDATHAHTHSHDPAAHGSLSAAALLRALNGGGGSSDESDGGGGCVLKFLSGGEQDWLPAVNLTNFAGEVSE
jgi:hypothetical protein